jgi:uncharacterized protein YndB with AHSA1/START domain
MLGIGHTIVTRRIQAAPGAVYAALLDPVAVARWKVPDGMRSEVHEWEPRPGGRFRVSLTYEGPARRARGKTHERTDTYAGRFVELAPGERVVEAIEFETAREDLRGAMRVMTTLTPVPAGTEVAVDHEGLPRGVPEADNRTGTEMALAKLAALLEAPR